MNQQRNTMSALIKIASQRQNRIMTLNMHSLIVNFASISLQMIFDYCVKQEPVFDVKALKNLKTRKLVDIKIPNL